jgi:hypothetical protein
MITKFKLFENISSVDDWLNNKNIGYSVDDFVLCVSGEDDDYRHFSPIRNRIYQVNKITNSHTKKTHIKWNGETTDYSVDVTDITNPNIVLNGWLANRFILLNDDQKQNVELYLKSKKYNISL